MREAGEAIEVMQVPRSRVPRVRPQQMTEPDTRNMRRLWCAVIYEQLRLALRANRDSAKYGQAEQASALSWIGGSEFRTVCSLAGLDPDWILRGLRARLDDGRPLCEHSGANGRERIE